MSPDERAIRIERGRRAVVALHDRELSELKARQAREVDAVERTIGSIEASDADALLKAVEWLAAIQERPAVKARHKAELKSLKLEHKAQRRKFGIIR